MNKDKADFIENLTLVHDWAYKGYIILYIKINTCMFLLKNNMNIS